MAGLASLSFAGQSLTGALEYCAAEGIWLTDLPWADAAVNGVFRHRLAYDGYNMVLRGRGVEARYRLGEDAVTLHYRMAQKVAPTAMRLCLRDDMVQWVDGSHLQLITGPRLRLTATEGAQQLPVLPAIHSGAARSWRFIPKAGNGWPTCAGGCNCPPDATG